MSKQREVILTQLRKLKSHPTADELYPIVKKVMPSISLGTLYRNLNLLADAGEILRLEYAGTQKRFDGNAGLHYHFRCNACGRVYDVDVGELEEVENHINTIKEHNVEGFNLEFYGVCGECK